MLVIDGVRFCHILTKFYFFRKKFWVKKMFFSLFRKRIKEVNGKWNILDKKVQLSGYHFTINESELEVLDDEILDNSINSIIINNNITTVNVKGHFEIIGDDVFNDCPNLTSINLPETITEIGKNSFTNCPKLASISLLPNIVKIDDNSMQHINISSFFIPKSCLSIGLFVFHGCYSLEELVVDDKNMFYASKDNVLYTKDMKKLIYYSHGLNEEVFAVPDGVKIIASFSFASTMKVRDIILPFSIIEIETFAFKNANISRINLDTFVAPFAFEDCHNLTHIDIGPRYNRIQRYTFNRCGNLTGVTIPSTVTLIQEFAFNECENMTFLVIEEGVSTLEYGCFHGCCGITEVIVPNSVVHYNPALFMDCGSLKSVKIPWSVVDELMFQGCSSLVSVDLTNIKKVCADSFKLCKSLASIKFGDSLEYIGREAFGYCESLVRIDLPRSLKQMNDFVFYGCKSLKRITVHHLNNYFTAVHDVLYDKAVTKLVQYPAGHRNKKYMTPNTVVEVLPGALGYAQFLTEVILREQVLKVGNAAFSWSDSLKVIHYCGSIKQKGYYFFNTKISSIYVPFSYDGTTFGEIDVCKIDGGCPGTSSEPQKEANEMHNLSSQYPIGIDEMMSLFDVSKELF